MDDRAKAELLQRVRELCLSFPETSERLSHGAPRFFVLEKRSFVAWADNHHGDGRLALWCAAPPGAQELWLQLAPDYFFRPPYMGPFGWVGIRLDREADWDEVTRVVEDAYVKQAPRRLVIAAGLGGDE